jgi:hypothetical protein
MSAMSRIARAAEKRADMLRARVRKRLAATLPGVTLSEEGDRIVLSGSGLVRRWIGRDDLRDWREMEP